jgi:hypothetical protein
MTYVEYVQPNGSRKQATAALIAPITQSVSTAPNTPSPPTSSFVVSKQVDVTRPEDLLLKSFTPSYTSDDHVKKITDSVISVEDKQKHGEWHKSLKSLPTPEIRDNLDETMGNNVHFLGTKHPNQYRPPPTRFNSLQITEEDHSIYSRG